MKSAILCYICPDCNVLLDRNRVCSNCEHTYSSFIDETLVRQDILAYEGNYAEVLRNIEQKKRDAASKIYEATWRDTWDGKKYTASGVIYVDPKVAV